jgi:hypothetical protein
MGSLRPGALDHAGGVVLTLQAAATALCAFGAGRSSTALPARFEVRLLAAW